MAICLPRLVRACLILAAFAVAAPVRAQGAPPADAAIDAAFRAAGPVAQRGPVDVKLIDQATLKLPEGYVYIPAKEAAGILTAMGNRPSSDLLGLVFPGDPDGQWFVSMRYIPSGYIKDDDAKDWNADDMLAQIKEGTEDANKERVSRGIPAVDVIGWVEKPQYDNATHRLKWSVSAKDRGAPAGVETTVNYNTYALGREGFVSMNLVTDLSIVESKKPVAAQLLNALAFNDGKRYADFNASTDRIAEYGLAALIGGVAAKKLGLFALIAVFFAKFFKVIVIAGLAIAGGVYKYMRGKKATAAAAPAPAPAAPAPVPAPPPESKDP